MITKVLGLFIVTSFIAVFILGIILATQNDAKKVAYRETLPSMERVGDIIVNNTTLHLWTFDFEGKQCLWATGRSGTSGRAGLTCWEKMP